MTVLHRKRERSRQLVEKRKEAALKETGKLSCEACGFDFAARYGKRGVGFIECHHTKPVETLGDGTPTHLSDLALLCANCHRMIHAKRPWLTIAELKTCLAV
ncbi:MAG: HNH endonuclease [Acidobacteriaceae bacterium]|nr:HNH endonuclease [Acidobacteriaceae bacterium]